MNEVTCFRCRKKGHISPQCPSRSNRVKRIKIPAEKMVSLRRNEVFGNMGEYQVPITLDTGADITVVPAKCVLPHQLTGEVCELKSFNNNTSQGQVCNVQVAIDGTVMDRRAVTQPGESLGWFVCLSMDLTDKRERNFLLAQMKNRAALTEKETWYLPPEVREGVLLSGVLAKEATVVQQRWEGKTRGAITIHACGGYRKQTGESGRIVRGEGKKRRGFEWCLGRREECLGLRGVRW